MLTRKDPPTMLIVGDEDTTVPCHQTLEMDQRRKAAGVAHETIVLPGLNHSFLGKTPEETRDANLTALIATFPFLRSTARQGFRVQGGCHAMSARPR
jgi:acetyl esterase/lipase